MPRKSPPVVLIVGRPNVGKSTLFNRLAGRAAALVFDRPGVTRDLNDAELTLGGRQIRLMDSAGWPYPSEDGILNQSINSMVERTIQTCQLVLWVVDGRAGKTGAEDALAERLRPFRRKTVLVLNKLDDFDRQSISGAESEFAGLPWTEAVPITAKHGRGIGDLLSMLESHLNQSGQKEESGDDAEDAAGPLKLCMLGRPNVGKSTLVNFLLNQDRMVVSDRPGTTRDAIGTEFRYRGRVLILVDTPGVRRSDRITDGLEKTMSRLALMTARHADVGLLILDISQGLVEQDVRLVSHLWEIGVTSVVAANKWDLAEDKSGAAARDLETEFREKSHGAADVPFVLISAKTGHGIGRLMKTIFDSHATAGRAIRTPELNRRLQEWNAEFPPGLFHGKPGKLKYAVQVRKAPQEFKIFVNNPKHFRRESLRYLEKRFRESFDLRGVPILIHLEQSPGKM